MSIVQTVSPPSSNKNSALNWATSLELPFLAVVERVTDRGFGFARCEAFTDELFFHVAGQTNGQTEMDGLEPGAYLICQVGSRSQDPDRLCIVQWMRYLPPDDPEGALDVSQANLSLARGKVFANLGVDDLHRVLGAYWYRRNWGREVPKDLNDPVFAVELLKRLGGFNIEDESQIDILTRIENSPFTFSSSFKPEHTDFALFELLSTMSLVQLAALGIPQIQWLAEEQPDQKAFSPLPWNKPNSKRKLTESEKLKVLEWYLVRSLNDDAADAEWLQANDPIEVASARRIMLQYDTLPTRFTDWLVALADKGWLSDSDLQQLSKSSAFAAASVFTRLSSVDQAVILQVWAKNPVELIDALKRKPDLATVIAQHVALAIDLETDGEKIWEIGCAEVATSDCLFNIRGKDDLAAALAVLSQRISSYKILVGHNILAWDWPILTEYLPNQPEPLIWDTQFVQYLLEPAAASHALGGAHTAQADAEATFALFAKQLNALPSAIAIRLISGQYKVSAELLSDIIDAINENRTIVPREAPDWLEPERGHLTFLLPHDQLHDLNWVANVALVEVDPNTLLAFEHHEIDLEGLIIELPVESQRSLGALLLKGVLAGAKQAGIAIRQSMVPSWLRKYSPEFELALARSGRIPNGHGITKVAPLPQSSVWWRTGETKNVRCLLREGEALLLQRRTGLDDLLADSTPVRRAVLRCLYDEAVLFWTYADQPARRLETKGGWRSFESLCLPTDLALLPKQRAKRRTENSLRPVLIRRENPSLFPGTEAQASYWRGVLLDLCALKEANRVTLLLISSTDSQDMLSRLRDAAVALGIAEQKPQHHSRREHLLRAAQKGFVILDYIDNWRDWQSLAQNTQINLLPVIEAVPLEEWFALEYTESAQDALRSQRRETASAAIGFTEADLLKQLPDLVERFMAPWLEEAGLATGGALPVLFDARLDAVAFAISAQVSFQPLYAEPLSEEQEEALYICLSPFEIHREAAPFDFASMETFLTDHWQPKTIGLGEVKGFKPTQSAAIHAIAERAHDVMVALPTGEGKSVLFQVPALCRGLRNRKLTLVLSPLKALMRDQVVRLHDQGFIESVDQINSDRPSFEISEVTQGLLDNRITLLYVAPERLRNARFLNALLERIKNDGGLEYVVFDEAHCINQWGYDFRPDYFHAFNQLMSWLRRGQHEEATPFILLSATLTASDRHSLGKMLERGSLNEGRLPLQICPDPNRIDNPLRDHIRIDPVGMRGDLLVNDGFKVALGERLPPLIDAVEFSRKNTERTGQRSAVLIFVTRRAHADALASKLTQDLGVEVESFHAGLDAGSREDIYYRFKDGQLDYLVATKAFGMGMDIPDIHRVVHMSSPFYLEDYLQEVGRIGRGVQERQRAGLNSLHAILLSSAMDFERMRGMRAQNDLAAVDIDKIEDNIREIAEDIRNRPVALVPQHGFEPFETATKQRAAATKLALAMFWLEKAGHLSQVGKIADTITAELNLNQLSVISQEKSQDGAIAKIVLTSLKKGTQAAPQRMGVDENAILLESFRKSAASAIGSKNSASNIKVMLNIAQIRREAGLLDLGQVMTALAALQKRNALKLIWVLEFAERKLLEEESYDIVTLIKSVGHSAQAVLQCLRTSGLWLFDPENLLINGDWTALEMHSAPSGKLKELEARRKRFTRAWFSGLRSLLRNSGVRLRETIQPEDGALLTEAELKNEKVPDALERCNLILSIAPTVLELIQTAMRQGVKAIEVFSLIAAIQRVHPEGTFKRDELSAVLRLLSSLNLVSAQPELVPLSYIIKLTGHKPGFGQHNNLVEELADVNEMARLRGEAMEIFTHLPVEAHGDFVTQYFSQLHASGMEAFLTETLGAHETDGDDFFRLKIEALRATQISEFFERYENSQEPAQWQAICHAYDQHLLVNAGPGAGKTSVLVGRITHLIRNQGLKPSEIIVLAFNRAVVSEIRQRLRVLFRSLGLGSYAARLRVSTFHGLAARYMKLDRQDGDTAYDKVLSEFAAKLTADQEFRVSVAGDCRAVLIDEFQDMSEDVWSIIQSLHQGSGMRAGVMAIGDDDQDILRWQRKKEPFFAEGYFDLFRQYFGREKLTELELKVNFRSGAEIVDFSQKMITGVFARNQSSRRLKATTLCAADGAIIAQVERRLVTKDAVANGPSQLTWDQMLIEVANLCRENHTAKAGSLAILCRQNDDVAALHQYLAPYIPAVRVQGAVNLRIATLRHVGLWLDYIDSQIALDDLPMNEATQKSLLSAFASTAPCPISELEDDTGVALNCLWELCVAESPFPHLSVLVEFIRGLQLDEFLRLSGNLQNNDQIVLSTIHKVKGLEFDTVIVMPSRAGFGMNRGVPKQQIERDYDAAEEARLYYVAMTRAKRRLIYYMGPREEAWGRPSRNAVIGEQGHGYILSGGANEIYIGWSMQNSTFHPEAEATQIYIEKHVKLGDQIIAGGRGAGAFRALLHQDHSGQLRQIGFLANDVGAGNAQSNLKVSAVVRYSSEKADPSALSPRVAQQSWGYVVLVSGLLR